jgi:hypothetical protein
LINKRKGANLFTDVGGLRDKFTDLDPEDPIRNPRRKHGMYGACKRPYIYFERGRCTFYGRLSRHAENNGRQTGVPIIQFNHRWRRGA